MDVSLLPDETQADNSGSAAALPRTHRQAPTHTQHDRSATHRLKRGSKGRPALAPRLKGQQRHHRQQEEVDLCLTDV
jgi:hypothetical protein